MARSVHPQPLFLRRPLNDKIIRILANITITNKPIFNARIPAHQNRIVIIASPLNTTITIGNVKIIMSIAPFVKIHGWHAAEARRELKEILNVTGIDDMSAPFGLTETIAVEEVGGTGDCVVVVWVDDRRDMEVCGDSSEKRSDRQD